MRIFLTGGTGLIGRRLIADRLQRGDELLVLTRDADRAAQTLDDMAAEVRIVQGDAMTTGSWQKRIDGCTAVVHLAGAGVADRRWTPAYKKLIVDSRIKSTQRVVEAVSTARVRPAVLVSGSAIGWYGECGERELDETAPAGDDFFSALAAQWEAEAQRAAADTRVVTLRTGVVLDPRGGALGGLLPIFRLGLGGPIGSGRQYMSWIHWKDLVGLIDLALGDARLSGPLNGVGPEPVTSRRFARTLGRVLGRPAILPTPVFALRIVMGEMGTYAAMSQRVIPRRALEHGYRFAYPELEPALESLVLRKSRDAGD